jgi:hypothetical protein
MRECDRLLLLASSSAGLPLNSVIGFVLDQKPHVGDNLSVKLEDIKKAAFPACREFDVKRLDAFGSISRDATNASSDVDLLVEFREPGRSPAKRFFGLLHQMEDALGCEVDLLTMASLRNPYFRARVLREKIPVYEG